MIKHHPFLQKSLGKILLSASMIVTTGYAAICGAHGHDNIIMDPAGNKATFTALARAICDTDADYLRARIRDKSAALPGLFVSLQLVKGGKAISITDTTPGDAEWSPFVELHRGGGQYLMIVDKTMAGTRTFDVEYHCMTVNNEHTGTEIIVDQFE